VSVEKKDYQEIEENKVNKVSRDIWVFQEMLVKKVNLENLEEQVNLENLDFQENLEDLVILVYLVKWEIKVFLASLEIKVKEEKKDRLV
jgi:hypothetical protein